MKLGSNELLLFSSSLPTFSDLLPQPPTVTYFDSHLYHFLRSDKPIKKTLQLWRDASTTPNLLHKLQFLTVLGRAHIGLQSSVAPHPAPCAPAGPRLGHAGCGLHRGDHDQDQRLPRHRQDWEEAYQVFIHLTVYNVHYGPNTYQCIVTRLLYLFMDTCLYLMTEAKN